MGKYGTFENVVGRGRVYGLKRPLCFSDHTYRKLKFNPNVGIESYVNMIDPPQHVIYAIRLKGNKDV